VAKTNVISEDFIFKFGLLVKFHQLKRNFATNLFDHIPMGFVHLLLYCVIMNFFFWLDWQMSNKYLFRPKDG